MSNITIDQFHTQFLVISVIVFIFQQIKLSIRLFFFVQTFLFETFIHFRDFKRNIYFFFYFVSTTLSLEKLFKVTAKKKNISFVSSDNNSKKKHHASFKVLLSEDFNWIFLHNNQMFSYREAPLRGQYRHRQRSSCRGWSYGLLL